MPHETSNDASKARPPDSPFFTAQWRETYRPDTCCSAVRSLAPAPKLLQEIGCEVRLFHFAVYEEFLIKFAQAKEPD